MTMMCPRDNTELFPDTETMCPRHLEDLVPAVRETAEQPGDDAGPAEPAGDSGQSGESSAKTWSYSVCWHCGTPSPHEGNSHCINQACGRSLVPPAVHIRFADGEVALEPGERAELGRQGQFRAVFRAFPNVSRRHAVVRADERGAWVELCRTPNGTFVNGTEVLDAAGHRLRTGDALRFARNAEGTVTLYDR